MIIKKCILPAIFLLGIAVHLQAQTPNKKDSIPVDRYLIEQGDEVIYALDHMARIPYLEFHKCDTNRDSLNIYGFSVDSVPQYDSDRQADAPVPRCNSRSQFVRLSPTKSLKTMERNGIWGV